MSSPFWKSLGPGLIWAATAIGVSHLVQSTRAGATYGFALVGAVLLANVLKYPFFEFGPRYAAATGESLLEGYARLGRYALATYLALTIATMFTVVGAVTFVTGSLATQIFGDLLSPLGYSVVLLAASAALLVLGRYPLLDTAIKLLVVTLTLSTLAAVVLAAGASRPPAPGFEPPSLGTLASFSFVIALVGWMPSAVDISVWHSLWTLERARQTGHRPSLRSALLDFNIGYIGTTLLALAFLALGAFSLYGRQASFATTGGAFAAQLIRIYSDALGGWSRPLIVAAAFTTMFSTTLACTDGFPRVLQRAAPLLWPRLSAHGERLYWWGMGVVVSGSLLLISFLRGHLTFMIDLATTLSFLTSPVIGYFNYRVVTGAAMPESARPSRGMRYLSLAGLGFGVALGGAFILWRFVLRV